MSGSRVRSVWAVFRAAFRNRPLVRLELAFAAFNAAEWAVWVSVLVFAYGRGGAGAAGAMAIAQLVPSAILDPYIGVLIDRHRAGRVLFWGFVLQAVGMAAVAVAIAGGAPLVAVFPLAMVVNLGISVPRPAVAALLPAVVRSPEELTAANVVSGWMESGPVLVAPAVAGVLIGIGGPALPIGVMAGLALVGAALVLPLPGPPPVAARRDIAGDGAGDGRRGGVRAAVRTVWAEPSARLLLAVLGAQFVLIGALDLLYVVLAISVLKLGPSGAGYLNAAFGAGAVIGGVVTAFLVGRRRLAPTLAAGTLTAALALGLLGVFPTVAGAFVLLAAAGMGSIVFEVTGRTLLQRAVPADVLAGAFGLLEALMDIGLALGSLLVPVLVAVAGARAALVGTGLVFALSMVAAWRWLRAIDGAATVPQAQIGVLRSISIFAPLPAPALEGLARALEPVRAKSGQVVVRQGDPGDRYYAVADGELDVIRNGLRVATLGRGDGFGEIALIREIPRTATVMARTDASLYALAKEPFVLALTGHPAAADEAAAVASSHMGRDAADGPDFEGRPERPG